jgi:hypothetical protein
MEIVRLDGRPFGLHIVANGAEFYRKQFHTEAAHFLSSYKVARPYGI